MVAIMKGSGKITIWKVLVFTSGTMVENMKANIRMIRNMASVFIHGLMVDVMKAIGGRVNSMALEPI